MGTGWAHDTLPQQTPTDEQLDVPRVRTSVQASSASGLCEAGSGPPVMGPAWPPGCPRSLCPRLLFGKDPGFQFRATLTGRTSLRAMCSHTCKDPISK